MPRFPLSLHVSCCRKPWSYAPKSAVLGGALLAALEKYDAEGLALLRAGQEVSLLRAVRQIKQLQIKEANANLAGLQATQP